MRRDSGEGNPFPAHAAKALGAAPLRNSMDSKASNVNYTFGTGAESRTTPRTVGSTACCVPRSLLRHPS